MEDKERNEKAHSLLLSTVKETQQSFVSLNSQYIWHILTLSLGVVSLVIPLLTKNEILNWNKLLIFWIQIGFFSSILFSILFYVINIFLEKGAIKFAVDNLNNFYKNMHQDEKEFHRQRYDIQNAYYSDCYRKFNLWLSNTVYYALNIVFVLSLIWFFVILIHSKII